MKDHAVRVLFLCTGNACRSPMAEALARVLGKGRLEASSAGTSLVPVHPLAVRAMKEIDIDILGHQARHLDEVAGSSFDFVITVCDRVHEKCPTWPGAREHIHWSFTDPAEAIGSEEERLAVFRRVRDEIGRRIQVFLLANHIGDGPPER